ncbi:T3SS (YopN, CesT) and YbjN peptide-binding chaperone 1 [Rhodococcus sp. (in: high G+C Gram-positive bacteria)]|uniref:T3SS (YopN, CesT) and YbjN peptide-binding chaperone 1 n=1 Tax=Rhodococcus sp. TaxID=1831 RepID=UPI003B8A6C7D
MFDSETFDAAIDRSWNGFQRRLADHLAAMRNDDVLVLEWAEESTVEGFAPWVQFLVWDDVMLRGEVSSNAYLAPRHQLAPAAENILRNLGWSAPTHGPDEDPDEGSSAFFIDREQRWADQCAAMTVTTLREVWSVPHPSFLRPEIVGTLAGADLLGIPDVGADDEPGRPQVDDTHAIVPDDPQELRDLIAGAVEQALGFTPRLDQDGDVIVTLDDQPVFVIAHPDQPLVRAWMPLLHSITGRTRAAELICDLTRRWPAIRFTLDEDRLNASIDVSANPFVPRHLADALDQLSRFAASVDAAFAARFGGARIVDDPPDDGFDGDAPTSRDPSDHEPKGAE